MSALTRSGPARCDIAPVAAWLLGWFRVAGGAAGAGAAGRDGVHAGGPGRACWLGSAPEAIRSTGWLWQDRRPRPFTYRIGAGPDDNATSGRLWDYVADLATSQAGLPRAEPGNEGR